MELRALALLALAACVPDAKRLVIPDEMRTAKPGPTVAASAGSPVAPAAPVPRTAAPTPAQLRAVSTASPAVVPTPTPAPGQPHSLLRLVEHGRVWEVELPEQQGGFEVRVPLGPPAEAPTAADHELLGKEPEGQKPLPPRSYLTGVAKIAEMYASHRYELALIEAVDLEQQYPKEARIEAMKGSLYQKLGKTELAREAWKKALELDPSDTKVAEALRGLKGE